MAIVTFSRQLGSGGDIIASKVAKELGYDLINSNLIVQIAEEAGVSVEYAKSLDERSESRAMAWLKSWMIPHTEKFLLEKGKHLDEVSYLNPEGYAEYVKSILLGLAEKGNIVIVGRGGQFILKDRGNAFHIHIIAEMESRVQWLCENYNFSKTEARNEIKKSDTTRRNYICRFFHADLDDPLAYHIVINTSIMGINLATDIINDAAKKFSASHE